MQSDDTIPPDSLHDDQDHKGAESRASLGDDKPAPTPLRREAIVMARERNRSALIAACCSLAGVGMGFGLSQVASSNTNCTHHLSVSHERAVMPAPRLAPAPRSAVTWLGVEVQSGGGHADGAMITEIVPGSPAEMAGLDVGDMIIALGDKQILSSQGLVQAVREQPIGRSLIVTSVNLQGERHQTPVVLGAIAPRDLRDLRR